MSPVLCNVYDDIGIEKWQSQKTNFEIGNWIPNTAMFIVIIVC
jgi:hypothetical protein